MADPSKYPTRLPPYGLRIPPALKGRIEESAKANNRTLHAEILITLEAAYPAPTPVQEVRALIEEIIEAWARTTKVSEAEDAMDSLSSVRDDLNETLKFLRAKTEERRIPEKDIPF